MKKLAVSTLIVFSVLIAFLVSPRHLLSHAQNAEIVWPVIELVSVMDGFAQPVHITHAGDGSGRLFVVEQNGYIRIIKNQIIEPIPFLDIHERVLTGGEQGLLSAAFPPEYAEKGYFYVYYTNQEGDNQVSRFQSTPYPDIADPESEEIILHISHPDRENHNGGQIAFGPDGYLYIATGDGGGGGDPDDNSQNTSSLLGKLLRIDVEFDTPPPTDADHKVFLPILHDNSGPKPAYRVPADNPFVSLQGYRPEIWSLGLRNPWRFSFDRLTGDLFTADVGQSNYEEVNYQPTSSQGGENYGWNIMEGLHCYNSETCDQTGLTLPVSEYNHDLGCSITGGHVYRGSTSPSMEGFYFFADYCSGRIWALTRDNITWISQELLSSTHYISTFGEDEDGELYIADRNNGGIYQVVTGESE